MSILAIFFCKKKPKPPKVNFGGKKFSITQSSRIKVRDDSCFYFISIYLIAIPKPSPFPKDDKLLILFFAFQSAKPAILCYLINIYCIFVLPKDTFAIKNKFTNYCTY